MRASSLTSAPTRVSRWRTTGCITENSETAERNRKTLLPTTGLAKVRSEQRPPHSPMFFRRIVKRQRGETVQTTIRSFCLSNEEVHRPEGEQNLDDEKNTRPEVNSQHLIYLTIAADVADNCLSVLLLLFFTFFISNVCEIIAPLIKNSVGLNKYIVNISNISATNLL